MSSNLDALALGLQAGEEAGAGLLARVEQKIRAGVAQRAARLRQLRLEAAQPLQLVRRRSLQHVGELGALHGTEADDLRQQVLRQAPLGQVVDLGGEPLHLVDARLQTGLETLHGHLVLALCEVLQREGVDGGLRGVGRELLRVGELLDHGVLAVARRTRPPSTGTTRSPRPSR
ncbi:hypothetical protein ABZY05_49670 [Streptomyces canus]|uniref:hypothetical protein n=1 Tax=Streptomyces canus TaxID=58343 RepID=UPI0033A8BE0D